MRNCRRENFDLDCANNKNKRSTNKKSKLNKVLLFISKKSESKEQNCLKIIQPFMNPSSCYSAAKKSQQIFHTTFVINFIIKNLILAGTNKNCQLVRENY